MHKIHLLVVNIMIMTKFKKSLLNNVILTMFALVLLGLTKLIFNIAIGRIFGAAILGSISIAISTSLLLSFIITTGFGPAAVKFLAEHRGRGDVDATKDVFKFILVLMTLLSLVIMGAALLFSSVISERVGIDRDLFIFATALIPLYALYMFYKNAYYGLDEIKKYAKIELLSDIIFFISLFVVVFYIKSLLLLPFIIMYIVFLVISIYNLRTYLAPSGKHPSGIYKNVLMFAGISFIGTFASMSRANLSITLSGAYVGATAVGYYAAAYSILTIFQFVPMAVRRVIAPTFSHQYGQNNISSVSKLLNISTTYLLIILSFMGSVGIILSGRILQIMYGTEYVYASTVLQIMIISIFISIITMPSVSSLSSTKYVKIPNIAGVLGLITSLVFWVIMIPRFGIEGTAIGYLSGTVVNSLIPLYYARKYYMLDLWRNLKIVATTVLILLVSLAAKNMISNYPDIVSAVLFVAAFVIINRSDLRSICRKLYLAYRPK